MRDSNSSNCVTAKAEVPVAVESGRHSDTAGEKLHMLGETEWSYEPRRGDGITMFI